MRQAKILMIDDCESDRTLTSFWFTRSDFVADFRTACSGPDALRHLESVEPLPDIILLDVNLPGLDGFELLEQIRARAAWSDLTVIMLTGSSIAADCRRALQSGARLCLAKPNDADEFQALVDRLRDIWQAQSSA